MTPLGIGILVTCLVVGGSAASVATAGAMGHGPMAGWMAPHATGGMGCHMCASSAGTSGNGTLVLMRSSQFLPTTLSVHAGDTVTWRNDDKAAHTVTSDDGAFDSGPIAPGASWSHVFAQPGTVSYHCRPHSAQGSDGAYEGMVGRIVAS